MYDIKPEAKLFLQRLKEETNEAHTGLESNELSQKIMSSELSTADYAAYLSKMYSLHQVLEERIFPLLSSVFPDLEARKKAGLILEDLRALNAGDGIAREFTEDISFAQSEAGALGFMYVMEGSALGGKVILKQLQKTLPQEVYQNATRYFSVYGDKIGGMWMQFLNAFSGKVLEENMEEDVIKNADKTFAVIHRWFEN